MRSYRQYCALAKGLDVVGDRWSLLIVRELLLRGPCRYTDLRYGLPGIATNMLADRLRDLEETGIIRREAAPPPIATTLFHLTSRGQELAPVLRAIGRWGASLMGEAAPDDVFRSHWLSYPVELLLTDQTPDGPPVTIEVHTADEPMLIEAASGRVRARPGTAEHPDAVLTGPPDLVLAVLMGQLGVPAARRRGLHVKGDTGVLGRLRPRPAAPPP
jgi:DNA-binding HxlR family transcriptional regulator